MFLNGRAVAHHLAAAAVPDQNQLQLPERGVALDVVVLALIDVPGLHAAGGRVRQARHIVAVAERHLQKDVLSLLRDEPRLLGTERAVAEHRAAELADVPVEGIAVVAHVLVLDIEAAVLDQRPVGVGVEILLAVVEHAQDKDGDLIGKITRKARVAGEDRRLYVHVDERRAAPGLPALADARVLLRIVHKASSHGGAGIAAAPQIQYIL